MDLGRGKVIGKFTQLFQETSLLLLVLDKVAVVQLTIAQIVSIAVIGTIVVWFTGWLYMILKMDVVSQILKRYRDVMFRNIHDMINEKGDFKDERRP